jgi:murein DD-endopeptidase MepM/ murein hydrolase activator NlpD
MMRKNYTLLVIDDRGSRVRETIISKRTLATLSLICILAVLTISAGSYRYVHLNRSIAENSRLREQLLQQQTSIDNQHRQIQAFAQTINELKADLVSLNGFEKKIRIMANLDHKHDQASLFSIGGSMPDDLDANLPLKKDNDRLVRQMHEQLKQVNQASAVQRKSFETLLTSLKDKINVLAATPSLRPAVGWISSDFGYRVSPFTGRREFHKGLDIANREGTPIIAPADGVVTYADQKWLMGNMITIDHGFGMVTRYGHLEKILIKAGDRVKRGETIALMGNTGRSTGPHLHYQVHINGVAVDPMQYILD